MSIALNARLKQLERQVAELLARIQALENRPKPGRPPKEQP
jgi:uncharacterized protein YceH (UPF0502 family)